MASRTPTPRVTHFNDCAYVARALVDAAARAGLTWGYVPPAQVRPASGFGSGTGRLGEFRHVLRHLRTARTSDVIHVHYATAVHLLQRPWIPKRPYVLHLHGTDIRRLWKSPATHDQIQRAIDGASAVYYTNLDTVEEATTARADATYMPAFVEPQLHPVWRPGSEHGDPTVLFVSRWDDTKGVETQLETARALRSALPTGTRLVGLDWGPGAAAAAELGIELVPRQDHPGFLELVASADVAIGQAAGIIAVSELEAMAIGPTVLCPVPSLADDGDPPPVLLGTVQEIVEQCLIALEDPRASSARLNARPWVLGKHTPDRWIPALEEVYRAAATGQVVTPSIPGLTLHPQPRNTTP
ncbi:glycosyltransferase family 4 protein [Leifsonia tongyongensis]|uniref:glycosyltransferase family 4 protein n=1 Tax=Leifsonia tongyongensis TaxID=1268043 RepID=UPI00187878FA|nr:glycosyltransferase family 4 protein [Diaminobutyricibacter tongyongensis]